MTAVTPTDAEVRYDRRARTETVQTERRGRERRKGQGRINRVAPRMSRLQIIGAGATAVAISAVLLTVLAMMVLGLQVSQPAGEMLALALGLSIVTLIMGSIEQRLIEVRLELMMLNGGQRRSDQPRTLDRRA